MGKFGTLVTGDNGSNLSKSLDDLTFDLIAVVWAVGVPWTWHSNAVNSYF